MLKDNTVDSLAVWPEMARLVGVEGAKCTKLTIILEIGCAVKVVLEGLATRDKEDG